MSLMFVMCLAGCDNVNKDDFESFINVNKTNVKVGETIKITASIKNNSNKSIKIKANHTDVQKIEDIINNIILFNFFRGYYMFKYK